MPDAYEQAKAVFLGEVVDIVQPKTTSETAPLADRLYRIKFKIQRSWKGIASGVREFSILSAQGRSGCFDFPLMSKGERYLVYADPVSAAGKWAVITVCSRSTGVRLFGLVPMLMNPHAIDPYSDIKELDQITKRKFNFDNARSRRRA